MNGSTPANGPRMAMDLAQLNLVRATFARLTLMPEVAGALFYERLFENHPEFRALFKSDMRVQAVKLMTMLATVVFNLHQPGDVSKAIHDLAVRHVDYGVKLTDYHALEDALVWMLGQTLSDDFTPPVRDAWMVCYREIAEAMKAAVSGL